MTNKQIKLSNHNANLNKIVCESLQEALLILMSQKNFTNISITELCNKAGVSRMAFYNNYKSKDELLKKIIERYTYNLINTIGSPFRQKTDILWYEQMFNYIKKDNHYLYIMFKSGFKYIYLSTITDIVLHDNSIPSNIKYMRLMWAGGISNAIVYWLESGMNESVNDMAQFCYNNLSVWTNE